MNLINDLENPLFAGDSGKVHALMSMSVRDTGGPYGIIHGYSSTERWPASARPRSSARPPRAVTRAIEGALSSPILKHGADFGAVRLFC